MSEREKDYLIPTLRFPQFEDDGSWSIDILSNKRISIFVKDRVGLDQLALDTYVSTENILPDYSGVSIAAKLPSSGSFTQYKKGDVLVSNIRPYLKKVWQANRDGASSNDVVVIRSGENVSSEFLINILKNDEFINYVMKGAKGVKMPRGDISSMMEYRVAFPGDREQKKIADCLASVDEAIDAEAQNLTTLKSHRKGLMQRVFPAEGETVPKFRFPEFRNAEEWKTYSVDELVRENILYAPKDGNHGNLHPKASDYVASGIPFVMANDIQNGEIDFSRCTYIKKELADSLQKGFALEGDVLLTHKGTVGEVLLVKKIEFPYLMLTPQVTYYRVKNKHKLSNSFLSILFLTEVFQKSLKDASDSGTRPYIGIIEQGKLKIVIPTSILEQQKIADCVTQIDAIIAMRRHRIKFLKAHKKGLMQQLFPSFDEVQG